MGIIKRIRRGKVRWFARWWSGGREHWQAAPTRAAAVGLLGKRRVEVFEGREFPGKRRRCTPTVNALLADHIAAVRREKTKATADACAPRLRAIVTVALNTALRRGEIAGLTWADVDLAAGFVHVRRSGPGATTGTKTHDPRGVPMNGTLRHLFTSLRPREVDPEALVFATRSGKPHANVRRDFATACDRAKVRDFRFHDTRHTAASRLVMDGASLRAVAEILGHRTLRMVMRCAHLSPAHMQETVGRLDGWTDRSGTVTQTVTRSKGRSLNPAK